MGLLQKKAEVVPTAQTDLQTVTYHQDCVVRHVTRPARVELCRLARQAGLTWVLFTSRYLDKEKEPHSLVRKFPVFANMFPITPFSSIKML